jgi:transcriptional regulator with XRE-family HTH domain
MTASTGEPAATSSAEAPPPTGPGDIPADTFGARLVLARYHAGRLSIEKAAERCGLNSEGWRRWEDGSKPRDKIEVAQAVSEGLRINLQWLMFGGPLLPARGRPTQATVQYQRVAKWPDQAAGRTTRRPRIIEQYQLAAA